MSDTDLENAELAGASAAGMNYEESDLPGTQLDLVEYVERHKAKSKDENAVAPKRQCVDLAGANLAGADLSNVDLSETVGLTQAQLDGAICYDDTVPPPGLSANGR